MAITVGDRVRLLVEVPHAPVGTEGQVFGVYRRDGREEVVVALVGRIVIVEREEVEPVEASK